MTFGLLESVAKGHEEIGVSDRYVLNFAEVANAKLCAYTEKYIAVFNACSELCTPVESIVAVFAKEIGRLAVRSLFGISYDRLCVARGSARASYTKSEVRTCIEEDTKFAGIETEISENRDINVVQVIGNSNVCFSQFAKVSIDELVLSTLHREVYTGTERYIHVFSVIKAEVCVNTRTSTGSDLGILQGLRFKCGTLVACANDEGRTILCVCTESNKSSSCCK